MVLDEDRNLYCAGEFTSVDGITANRVAFWDGATWTALGNGLNGTVHCLAYSDGTLYAGGTFSQAGGNSAINIAKWDGTEWSSLGVGPNGTVYAAAVVGDDLYVGGQFTIVGGAGGLTANNLARWDGEEWSTVGSGTNGRVNALLSNNNTLTAGGNFTLANGIAVNRVASWNGTEWTGLGSGVNGQVFALAQSGTDLFVGGEFTQAGGLSNGKKIAKWDGTTWSALATGAPYTVYSVATNGTEVYAGMLSSVIHWTGTAWTTLGSGTNGVVRSLVLDRLSLYTGGDFSLAGGAPASYAATAIIRFEGDIRVELPEGTDLADDSTVEFENIALDSTNGRYTFTVKNYGNLVLTVTNIALTGDDDLDSFQLETGDALNPIAPDDTKSFSVTFLPTDEDEKTATLEITSDDPDTPIFRLVLVGTATDAIDMYYDAAEDAGLEEFDTLPDEIPFGDGVENLLKYAFNMDLAGPDSSTLQVDGTSGLPRISIVEKFGNPFLRYEFLRRKGSGLVYTPQKSLDLVTPFATVTGTQTVQDIDQLWERVLFDHPIDLTSEPTAFGRVDVDFPPDPAPPETTP